MAPRLDKIIVVGDLHANWEPFNLLVEAECPMTVLACGDFGFWPRDSRLSLAGIKSGNTKVYWCDGNHEDHEMLGKRLSDEIAPNVFYKPRGSTLTLDDGRRVLFVGGASSVDKSSRTPGYNWFPEEVPTLADFAKIDAVEGKIDIVISHTCPYEFHVVGSLHGYAKSMDHTRGILSMVLNRFRPELWYFGHWHVNMNGEFEGTRWRALNMCPRQGWWMPID